MIRGDLFNVTRCFALSVLGGLFLVGCPGNLDNPQDFIGATGGTVGRSVEQVFQVSCGTTLCHDAVDPQSGLDLVSPDVASRTVGVNAVDANCTSEIIVIAGDPDESYMMKKIVNAPGICGVRMPVGTILDAEDTEVVREWIIDLGGTPAINDEGPDGGV